MSDGGMDSLLCLPVGADRWGKMAAECYVAECYIAECHFKDEDGVLALAALKLDTNGRLYELDIWKVDLSPPSHGPICQQDIIDGTPQAAGSLT